MLDFHTHILPRIDDGSHSMEETEALLKEERAQGVDKLVFTPHFYASEMSKTSFFTKRDTAYQEVVEKLSVCEEFDKLYLGAEVYYFPGMSKADMLDDLCIQGTRVILIEMPFVQWTDEMYQELKYIVDKRKLTVVLAHVERYVDFQRRKKVFEMVLDLPLYVQMNGGAIINKKKRKFAFKYLKKGNLIILGSDTHNMSVRKPNLEEARTLIADKFGEDKIQEIDAYSDKVFEE